MKNKVSNNFLNENNETIENIIKDCLVDFISSDWDYDYIGIIHLKHKKTYEIHTNLIKTEFLFYSGQVNNEEIKYIKKIKKIKNTEITNNEFEYYIDELKNAVLRLNQFLKKDIIFVFYTELSFGLKIRLKINIQILNK